MATTPVKIQLSLECAPSDLVFVMEKLYFGLNPRAPCDTASSYTSRYKIRPDPSWVFGTDAFGNPMGKHAKYTAQMEQDAERAVRETPKGVDHRAAAASSKLPDPYRDDEEEEEDAPIANPHVAAAVGPDAEPIMAEEEKAAIARGEKPLPLMY